ncbi:MAG: site-2 protease family protein [Chloroflexi bacterium]|nr:site-2 protease family protein [Chloroflexota bacterium]
MNRRTISLGTILGIPIRLDYSWFLIFAFLTWDLAMGYYPAELGGVNAWVYWALGAITAILLFGSVLLHELGHSVIARRYKIPVRKITLFLFGGVAEIGAEPPSPSSEFFIAIAGPLVSFGLAALFGVAQTIVVSPSPLFVLAKYLAIINGSLGLFNLVPGFPLDGGRIFRALVWGITRNLNRATQIAAKVGRGISFLFIALGIWQVVGGDWGGLWFVLIGWYLQSAATSQLQQQNLYGLFAGHRVSEAMNRSYVLAPAEMTLQFLVDHNLLAYWQRAFVVQKGDAIIGLLSWHDIQAIPHARWPTTTVSQAMVSMGQLHSVGSDTELGAAAEELTLDGAPSLPVVADGHVLGTLSREDVTWFLRRAHFSPIS